MSRLVLAEAARAWGTPSFAATLKRELEGNAALLPLQQALAHSSSVADTPVTVMVEQAAERDGGLRVTVGIFYEGIVAGCSCADDPTPNNLNTEHCRLLLEIDRDSGESRVSLLENE